MEETSTDIQSSEAQEAPSQKDNSLETNIANMRKKLEEQERVIKQTREQALAAQAKIDALNQQKVQDKRFLRDDQYVDPVHYNGLLSELDKVQRDLEQTKISSAKAELASKYNDFYQYVTDENLKAFELEEPETVETINRSSATYYNVFGSLYHAIKRSKATKNYQNKAKEIDSESPKIRSVHSIPKSTTGGSETYIRGRRLSPQAEAELYAEMNQHMPAHLQGR